MVWRLDPLVNCLAQRESTPVLTIRESFGSHYRKVCARWRVFLFLVKWTFDGRLGVDMSLLREPKVTEMLCF